MSFVSNNHLFDSVSEATLHNIRSYIDCTTHIHKQIDWVSMTQVRIDGILGNYVEFNNSMLCPTTNACPANCPSKHCWNNRICQESDTGKSLTVGKCPTEWISWDFLITASGIRAHFALGKTIPEYPHGRWAQLLLQQLHLNVSIRVISKLYADLLHRSGSVASTIFCL